MHRNSCEKVLKSISDVSVSVQDQSKPPNDRKWFDLDLDALNSNLDQLLPNADLSVHLSIDEQSERIANNQLAEERCRRLHCEHVIQEQNDRILQLEEKLAVANQLDNKKNDVLSKIKDAFDIVSGRCQKFETDSSKLNEMLQNADQRLAAKVVNYQKKINVLEDKLSKCLELMFQNQNKLRQFEEEKNADNLQMASLLHNLEKEKLYNLNLEESRKSLLNEIDDLKSSLVKEKSYATSLLKKSEVLETELKTLKENSNIENKKLQVHYERKYDELMQSKCNELQKLEKKFSDDILVKESAIMSLASDQIKELCEKNEEEIALLEEKHKEEMNLFALSYHQSIQKVETLQIESLRIIKNNFKNFNVPFAIENGYQHNNHMIDKMESGHNTDDDNSSEDACQPLSGVIQRTDSVSRQQLQNKKPWK